MSELRQLRGQGVFQPYRAPSWAGGEKAADGVGKTSTDRGKWNMCAPPNPWTAILPRTDTGLLLLVMRVVVHPECSFYLQLHEAAEFTDENSKRCPKTVELLRSAIPK